MDRNDIETAILSVSTPGVWFGDSPEARYWARLVNEAAATVADDDAEHFGFFATLTLPDVEGAIAEAEYALDQLNADGVVLLANNAGSYLGDPAFAPLMDFLNDRRAVVFVHPGELPAEPVPGVPSFTADFLLDTTRTALNLMMSGTMRRCPEIRFVLAHAGGFLPYIAYRAVLSRVNAEPSWKQLGLAVTPERTTEHYLEEIRQFWFDVALSSSPTTLPTLLAVADPERIVYGSDFPFAPAPAVRFMRQAYEKSSLADDQRQMIDRENAKALLKRRFE